MKELAVVEHHKLALADVAAPYHILRHSVAILRLSARLTYLILGFFPMLGKEILAPEIAPYLSDSIADHPVYTVPMRVLGRFYPLSRCMKKVDVNLTTLLGPCIVWYHV